MAKKQTATSKKVETPKKSSEKPKAQKPELIVENQNSEVNAEENTTHAPTVIPEVKKVAEKKETAAKAKPEKAATPEKKEKEVKEVKEVKEKTSKTKVDLQKVADFRRDVAGKTHRRSSIIQLAKHYFGDDFEIFNGLSFKEVYFKVGDVRIPEAGIFPIVP